jgi:hypothetical protein
MASFDLKSYARRGAEVRIAELRSELNSIYSAFPDLRPASTGRRGRRKVVVNHEEQFTGSTAPAAAKLINVEEATGAGTPARRKRRKMTAAQRKAVGERMRKYWAARKAAKK